MNYQEQINHNDINIKNERDTLNTVIVHRQN